MSDNYRNNNYHNSPDDTDDFFAQFDAPPKKPGQSQPSKTSQGKAPQGRPSQSRSSQSRPSQGRTSYDDVKPSRSSAKKKDSSNGNSKSVRGLSKRKSPAPGASATGSRSGNGPRGKRPTSKKKSVLLICIMVILLMVMAVGVFGAVVIAITPKIETDDMYSLLSQRSVMYDAKGNEIENLYFTGGNRTIVDYKDIPEDMVNAVVAIEDKKFWSHSGFNFIRMAGAVVDSVFGGGQISGTSTLTQQLARNVYLADVKSDRDIGRKIKEAYYTILLEKNLSKKQIMEAYLNTIYLGFNSYGVQAASQSYFSKNVQDLSTLECAALAALPQSPDAYALIQADYDGGAASLPVVSTSGSVSYLYNGETSKDRRELVLENMESSDFITSEQMNEALGDDLKAHMKVGIASDDSTSSYFTDFAIDQVIEDIVAEYGLDRSDAEKMLYTGGLKIYTTMDSEIQKVVENEFADNDNYCGVSYASTNGAGDIIDPEGEVLLRSYSHYFNGSGQFTLASDEYSMDGDGNMTILAGKRLNLYEVDVNGEPDVSIEFKGMYTRESGTFYFIESGALSIPQGYKKIDSSGNVIISAQFFKDYPDFFVQSDSSYVVNNNNYSLKQKTRQPQAATVIMENSTGQIKAMMGGRGLTGKQLFNRATSPRQPGSSMKPIGVYGPGIQMGCEYYKDNKTMKLDTSEGSDWGKYITAGSLINDAALRYNGRVWPKNWYSGYRGQMTLRKAVEQSVNVCAVKVYQQIGPDYSSKMLKKVGISTLDEEGEVNDLNPAALALGGMSRGVTPLDMTAAYATFVNGGIYKEPIAYTKVLDSNDELLFEKEAKEEQVYDEGVAWIMTDILRTTVSNGIATSARIGCQPVGGKTGTTDDNYDIWFAGFTPQYTSAIWMGTDMNMELTLGSSLTASFWADIMERICGDIPYGSFRDRPSNVVSVAGEYYISGTYSKVTKKASSDSTNSTAPTTEPSTSEEPTITSPTVTPTTTTTVEPSP
ncbi:MAG: hypothetical protein GX663_00835 [Clostridiales bacterium]|nr:hypothetical protein [Clostridiales bacterium]